MSVISQITFCGLMICGPDYIDLSNIFVSRDLNPPGWTYPEHLIISQSKGAKYPACQFVIGLVDLNQYVVLRNFYEQNKNTDIALWLKLLAPAISNLYICLRAPTELKHAVLKLPAIERLGLDEPDPTLLWDVEEIPIFHTLNLRLFREREEKQVQEIVMSLATIKVTRLSIVCNKRSDTLSCGLISLLTSHSDEFDMSKLCSKITSISCRHIMKVPYHQLLRRMPKLRRVQVFNSSDVDEMLSFLRPPLEVELREEASNAENAARIGASVTVFENSLFELSKDQIRGFKACTEMRDLSIVMKEGYDWEFVSTIQDMTKLDRLRICGDDSSENIRDPVVQAAPYAMYQCVQACPLLTKLVFNTIFISSEEIDHIFRTVGTRLESFIFGIYKQEKHPDEKFVDIMLSAGKHCAGSNSQLRFLGIPHPVEMNMNRGDVAPIPRERKIAFHEAATFSASRCPKLHWKCLAAVWDAILECERRVLTPGERRLMSPSSTVVMEYSDDDTQD